MQLQYRTMCRSIDHLPDLNLKHTGCPISLHCHLNEHLGLHLYLHLSLPPLNTLHYDFVMHVYMAADDVVGHFCIVTGSPEQSYSFHYVLYIVFAISSIR